MGANVSSLGSEDHGVGQPDVIKAYKSTASKEPYAFADTKKACASTDKQRLRLKGVQGSKALAGVGHGLPPPPPLERYSEEPTSLEQRSVACKSSHTALLGMYDLHKHGWCLVPCNHMVSTFNSKPTYGLL
jgi:hypothetical protein